ncbi:MAG: ferritin family protein [bacterium]|nr:MAG: ferritin family protein [bacterium]
MKANPDTGKTLLEAIKREIEGREFYLALSKKVKNPLVRRKILNLAEDELEHRETLSRLYWAQTGTEPGDLARFGITVDVPDMENMTLTDLLEMAMRTEKEASETYRKMANEAADERSAAFLEYLSEFEENHYETLAAELARVKKNPGWEDQGPSS